LEGLVLSSAPGAEICLPPMKWVRVSVIKTLLEGGGNGRLYLRVWTS
jgi:hypothetical protein